MNNSVIVQDLPVYIDPVTFKFSTINEPFLLSLFEDLDDPPVAAKIHIQTYLDGTPYAFAQIKFDTIEQAEKAISEVNFTKLDDRPIRLKLFTKEEQKYFKEGKGRILIKNLSQDIDIMSLYYTMSDYGEVIDYEIPSRNNKSFSYGIVQFRDPEEAKKVISELNHTKFSNQKVELFELNDRKSKNENAFHKNYQELKIFSGLNDYNQLIHPFSQKNSMDHIIISPPINYPLRSVLFSYSVYYQHSVSIYQNNKAFGVGNNDVNQLTHSKLKQFEHPSEFSIKQSKKQLFESFQSAVCGSNYTLFLCNPNSENDHQFLAINGRGLNDGKATAFETKGEVPISLYGGEIISASIDLNGSVYIIVNDSIFTSHLPEKKRAVLLACLNEKVVALSSDGYLYELSIEKVQNEDDQESIEFSIIDEVSEIEFDFVSGSSKHCLAVSKSGSVYARGDNSFGQCGVNSHKKNLTKFVKIKKFTSKKIISAFAGFNHSLFLNEKGAVFACGNNEYGQLLTNDKPCKENFLKPVKTVIHSGATFCIAGKGLSVVFLYSKPPPTTPNMKIEDNKNAEEGKEEKIENKKVDDIELSENESESDQVDEIAVNDDFNSGDGLIDVDEIKHEISSILNSLQIESQTINDLIEENERTNEIIDGVCKRLSHPINSKDKEGQIDNEKTAPTDQVFDTFIEEEEEDYNENNNKDDDVKRKHHNDNENDDDDDENEEEEFNDFDDKNSHKKTKPSNSIPHSIPIISFSNGKNSLDSLSSSVWKFGVTKKVEFFTGQFTPVTLVSITNADRLQTSLKELEDGFPIGCDFRFDSSIDPNVNNPISLFLFCSTKGVVIVANSKEIVSNGSLYKKPLDFKKICPKGIQILMKFLNSNFFYSKEISVYQKKLIQLFGKKFNIEDIEKTRLIPRNLTLNFDYLVEAVHGVPTADFSLKKLIWNNRPISEKVVVCAAFYVYGLRLIWRYSVRRLNDELIYSGVKKPVKLPNKSTLNNKKAEQIKKHKNKH